MPSRSPIHLLSQRISISRPVTQTNDYGLPVLRWKILKTNVPAKMQMLDGDSSSATRQQLRYRIYMPIETDVQQTDRIVLNNRQFQVLIITNSDDTLNLKTVLTTEVLP